MNLNREQIIKALECCYMQELEHNENCPECPYTDLYPNCGEYLGKDALSLIKELTDENKKITINMNAYGLTAKILGEEKEALVEIINKEKENKAEILKLIYSVKYELTKYINNCNRRVEEAKADTVRKMQERLKTKSEVVYGDRAVCVELIDQIASEMLEGINENHGR